MMKHIPIFLILLTIPLWAASDGWMTDFEAAKQKAKAANKDLLVNFTGSDWCGWCIKLKKEVFQKESFIESAPRSYVLVELDYPRKIELPEGLKKQNLNLRKSYSVTGFPTVMLCDADGRPYAKTGYQRGGADAYLDHLADLQKQKSERDRALAKAAQLEGPEKARALEFALSTVPRKSVRLYPKVLAQIEKSDPDDASGYMNKIKVEQASAKLRDLINPLFKDRKFTEVTDRVDDFINKNQPTGEALQTAMLYKLHALYMSKAYDDTMQLANKIIEINDTSKAARFANMIKIRLKKLEAAKRGEKP